MSTYWWSHVSTSRLKNSHAPKQQHVATSKQISTILLSFLRIVPSNVANQCKALRHKLFVYKLYNICRNLSISRMYVITHFFNTRLRSFAQIPHYKKNPHNIHYVVETTCHPCCFWQKVPCIVVQQGANNSTNSTFFNKTPNILHIF